MNILQIDKYTKYFWLLYTFKASVASFTECRVAYHRIDHFCENDNDFV